MDFDHDNVRLVVNEDRLSSLPDDLIHQILSHMDDTKFVVQTCLLLSSRWNLLWKSMPCLSFLNRRFCTQARFSKFVTNVLSRRNHQVEVSSVKLHFHGAASQPFVRKVADYAVTHGIQELIVISQPKFSTSEYAEYPPCLFSSPSLKHFTFSSHLVKSDCTPKIPKTPWNFPALTTLHLSEITLCEDAHKYLDLFSVCVNLKNLTLKSFVVWAKVFDIIAPRLSTLLLVNGSGSSSTVINVIAPQLENLTIINSPINHLEASPELSSLCYRGYYPPEWLEGCFRSLNEVSLCVYYYQSITPYTEEDARNTINMLQKLHSARFLSLNIDIVECLSSYPDLLSDHPSPAYSNLMRLNITPSMMEDGYKVKMSTVARYFLLENSPSTTIIMDLPEEPPTKAIKARYGIWVRAKLVEDIESCMLKLQSSLLEQEYLLVERKQLKEKTKLAIENLIEELHGLTKTKIMQSEPEKAHFEEIVAEMKAQIRTHLEEMWVLSGQEYDDLDTIRTNKSWVIFLLKSYAVKQWADMEARYTHQLEEIEKLSERLSSESVSTKVIYSDNQFRFQKLFPLPPP